MTPLNNGHPLQPPTPVSGGLPLRGTRTRNRPDSQSPSSSVTSLPSKRTSASVSSLFASTSTPPGSRPISPNRTLSTLEGSVFARSPSVNSQRPENEPPSTLQNTIQQAFVPHIAVYTSPDTDELTREKGFSHGLWQLLRPFGEKILGRVIIRDSIGASRSSDDFAVRFVRLGDGLPTPKKADDIRHSSEDRNNTGRSVRQPNLDSREVSTGGDIRIIESLLEKHISFAESISLDPIDSQITLSRDEPNVSDSLSPFYALYVKRLLSGIPMVPHETFAHPVACIIAISSRSHRPIEALRQLYEESSQGDKRLPVWVNGEYLRYYVLVHDEEKDDISKSMALFEQMKRHFGLHCHLLRLRSSQCILTDDDAIPFPAYGWLSADEELAKIERQEADDEPDEQTLCIYESDSTAIKAFIREMVTQSVVPSMERCISTWNDQIASRRRGISGRFLNLGKKWTGFGSSSRAGATSGPAAAGNFDTQLGFYKPDAPEALLRKLADYAFMLRDWKLAQSIYDLCRTDFNNDKAWIYHAAANEMAAISNLLGTQTINNKTRVEIIDQMLEMASYSYITRCGDSYGALRSLSLSVELLKIRGGSATDDAARWAGKLLEAKVVGPIGDALVKERIAACHASRKGTGSQHWGARTRKAALWNILAADEWLKLEKFALAERAMTQVDLLYRKLQASESLAHFSEAQAFLNSINHRLRDANHDGQDYLEDDMDDDTEEESEALDSRNHRKSLMGITAPVIPGLETAPLHTATDEIIERDDTFV